MAFLSIIIVAGAIMAHSYLLLRMFAKDPNLFFRVSPFHRACLRMDNRLYAGLTFLAAFLMSIVVGHLGWAGLLIAVTVAVLADWSLDEVRKVR